MILVKGANYYNWGLHGACLGGHKDLAELMMAKGAKDYNEGLQRACEEGHQELIELMIAKGAEDCFCGKTIEEHQVFT